MFTYQLRNRTFRIYGANSFAFPNSAEIIFTFQPLQPFGMQAGGGRTGVHTTGASVLFNANTGHHFVESQEPLNPLDVTIDEPGRQWRFQGNKLQLNIDLCPSNEDLTQIIHSLYYGFPAMLNIELADPPVIESVEGKVGETEFRWELKEWRLDIGLTDQDMQEQKIIQTYERFEILSDPNNRRLLAALHYYHVSNRLARSGNTPWEFFSECIVNLSKVLEVLFPPHGDVETLDAARAGLSALDYSQDEIERNFIPATALRNNLDAGHVDLKVYTREQLNALHKYAEVAEGNFRELFHRIMERATDGRYSVAPYVLSEARSGPNSVVDKIVEFYGED